MAPPPNQEYIREARALEHLTNIGAFPATATNRIPLFVRPERALRFFANNRRRFAPLAQTQSGVVARPGRRSSGAKIRAFLAWCYALPLAGLGDGVTQEQEQEKEKEKEQAAGSKRKVRLEEDKDKDGLVGNAVAAPPPRPRGISILFDLHYIAPGPAFEGFVNQCLTAIYSYGDIAEAIAVNVKTAHHHVLAKFNILVMPTGKHKPASPATIASDYATSLLARYFPDRGLAIVSNQTLLYTAVRIAAEAGRLSILITANSELRDLAVSEPKNPQNHVVITPDELPSLVGLPTFPLDMMFSHLVPTKNLEISATGTYRVDRRDVEPEVREYTDPFSDMSKYVGQSSGMNEKVFERTVLPVPGISQVITEDELHLPM